MQKIRSVKKEEYAHHVFLPAIDVLIILDAQLAWKAQTYICSLLTQLVNLESVLISAQPTIT